MRKNWICALLAAVLAFSFMSTAFAEGIPANATEKVTVAKGDTMYSLCRKNGFSYSAYKELLMKLNNMDDEYGLTKISAGKVLVLPTSEEAADELCALLNVESTKKADKKQENKPFSVLGDAKKIPLGDVASYYIISHEMERGETVSDLLKGWDMSIKDCSQRILELNGLSDFNHIPAGRSLYFPVEKVELTDNKTVTVMEHSVKPGDTAYSVCKAYGMDYNKALVTLQLLNPGVDFTKIKADQKLYIPVKGVVLLGVQTALTDGDIYSGYGVVVSCDEMIRIRRENIRQDLGLSVGAGAVPEDYIPHSGDYVYFICNTKDNTLTYIKYVYNVFSTEN